MKRYFTLSNFCVAFCLFSANLLFAQNNVIENKIAQMHQNGVIFENHDDLFQALPPLKFPESALEREAQSLTMNTIALQEIMNKRAAAMTISIPYNGDFVTVELYQTNILSSNFTVKTGDWKTTPYEAGAYYRGIIKGSPRSLVAMSFFDHEIMGVLCDPVLGNFNLGRLDKVGNVTTYALFNEKLLPALPFSDCVTRPGGPEGKTSVGTPENIPGCVGIFFEADYALFQNKGSVINTVNYVTSLFNAVSTIYGVEQISILLTQVYVWTIPDPYVYPSSGAALDAFVAYRTTFDGDLAHLVSLSGGNAGYGGVAYLNVLSCSNANYGVSGINSTFQTYPTYSWTLEVVSHELGHNFGSNHTHWCGWTGGAIDNCGPTADYAFETPPTCTTAPTPAAGGGTIMSYCHLVNSVGINLANGFGTQPGNLIRAKVASALGAACIASTCPNIPCGSPNDISVTAITNTSATIGWSTISAAAYYNIQYRVSGTSNWTTTANITSIPFNLNTLAAATTYEVQVRAVCGAIPSPYAVGVIFKTAVSACAEPNTLVATSTSATSETLNWTETGTATVWDVEYGPFGFALGTGTAVNVTTKPFLLTGLTTGAVYDYYVKANCGGTTSTWVGPKTFSTPFLYDIVANAVNVVVDAPCPGTNIYSNVGATVTSGEFSPTTANGGYWNTAATNTVWFKFTAPASGTVKITTDISPLGTLDDTQIALYNTTAPTSATNHLLLANDDGGVQGNGWNALGYYSGLTAGTVYYIQVDGWNTKVGTFCLEVSQSFALPAPTTCTAYTQTTVNGATAPNKWFNIYTKPANVNIGLPVAAIKSSLNLGTVTVQELRNSTVIPSSNGVKYMQRYYNFESSLTPAGARQVRLFFTDQEFSDFKTATSLPSNTIEDLNIYHYDGANEDCSPLNNTINTSNPQVLTAVSGTAIGTSGYFYLDFSSPSFSEMAAVFGTVALPLELLSFSGKIAGRSNKIEWKTASEKDLTQFSVEKSIDGIHDWTNISTQSPDSTMNYACFDAKPFPQTYYRLAIQNRDGSVEYSQIISLTRTKPDGIQSIAPNPAQAEIYVSYQSTQEQTVRFQIIAADGRIVLSQAIELQNGLNLLPFDISGLPNGLYYCLTNGSDGVSFEKF